MREFSQHALGAVRELFRFLHRTRHHPRLVPGRAERVHHCCAHRPGPADHQHLHRVVSLAHRPVYEGGRARPPPEAWCRKPADGCKQGPPGQAEARPGGQGRVVVLQYKDGDSRGVPEANTMRIEQSHSLGQQEAIGRIDQFLERLVQEPPGGVTIKDAKKDWDGNRMNFSFTAAKGFFGTSVRGLMEVMDDQWWSSPSSRPSSRTSSARTAFS